MRRTAVLLCLMCAMLAGCAETGTVTMKPGVISNGKVTAATVAAEGTKELPLTVAVVPFESGSADPKTGDACRLATRMVVARFGSSSRLRLVERERIDAVLTEIHRGYSGDIDEQEAVRIGKLLGANVLALGNITSLERQVYVILRLVKVDTGEIIGSVVEQGRPGSDAGAMADRAAGKLLGSIR